MKKIHYTDSYLLKPYHPVTIHVAGAGGTGSQVITNLARMNVALQALGHPGLHVTVFDPDIITEANIGRQLFSETELGQGKATAAVTRVNRFFGTTWTAENCRYPVRKTQENRDDRTRPANIIITCTDNTRSRLELWRFLKKYREASVNNERAVYYWMDFGNAQTTGQVFIGTVRNKIRQPASKEFMPVPGMNVITEEVNYSTIEEKDSGPSAHWRKHWKDRTCTSTPYWHKSAVTSYGGCSRKEEPCTGGHISIWTHSGLIRYRYKPCETDSLPCRQQLLRQGKHRYFFSIRIKPEPDSGFNPH